MIYVNEFYFCGLYTLSTQIRVFQKAAKTVHHAGLLLKLENLNLLPTRQY